MEAARKADGSMGRVLHVAAPLVLAASSQATRLFCDRVMLAHYSQEAFSASFMAGLALFTILSLFWFTTNYTGTFVAQYLGAGRNRSIGPAVWQGIFAALFSSLLMVGVAFAGKPLFRLAGFEGELLANQATYFRILSFGVIFPLLIQALGSFWSGRGKTWILAGIEWFTVVVNIGANYLLIFGKLGFPALGIAGAALGTVFAAGCGALLAFILFLRPHYRQEFNTLPRPLFDPALFRRLLRFGLPNGIQLFLDIGSFNTFVLINHSLGAVTRSACTIAFSLNAMAFVPMLGLGMGVTILVGQCIGARSIGQAQRTVINARYLILLYMGGMAALLVLCPGIIPLLFPLEDAAEPEATWELAAIFTRYIAAFLLFDGLYILYKSAIAGAGDTRFSMWAGALISWLAFAFPCLIAHYWFACSVHLLWVFLVSYVALLGAIFFLRYRHGRWRSLRVIEG